MREALGQLAGLKRRKTALEMLGAVVQKGLNKRIPEIKKSNKRQHESNDNVGESEGASEAPVSKKARTDAELTS